MQKNSHCRFCGFTLENLKCPKCGCLNPFRYVTNDNINTTFVDYSYNRYNQGSLVQKIYLGWMRLQAFLFATNASFCRILNLFLSPAIGGRPRLKFSSKEIFLDVGCGRGDFIRYLPESWNIQGTDIVSYGNQPKSVIIGNFEKLSFPKEYSIVRASHVLEHSLHPQKFLAKLIENTQKGGIIVISSPNSNSYAYRIFKNHWLPLGVESHFCILNIPAVSRYLTNHSCEILHTSTYTLFSIAGSLSTLVGSKKYPSVLFAFFAVLLLPFALVEFFTKKADSFIIYARKI